MTDAPEGGLAQYKRPLRYVMGITYALVGVLHFLNPRPFEYIVPPQLPAPKTLVYLSGAAEIALGVGVLFERTRHRAAVGIMLLLAAVFPANIYMAVGDLQLPAAPDWAESDALLYARLPLQAVLVLWAYWYTDAGDETA
jgi:uncharacterized membrane protein